MLISDKLKGLADVVRSKYYISDKLSIDEMASRVNNLTIDIDETSNMLKSPYDFNSGWIGVHHISSESGINYIWSTPSEELILQTIDNAEVNTNYVWSFYARADKAGDKVHTELFGGSGYKDFTLSNKWQRFISIGYFTSLGHPNVYFGSLHSNFGNISIALPVFTKLNMGGVVRAILIVLYPERGCRAWL